VVRRWEAAAPVVMKQWLQFGFSKEIHHLQLIDTVFN
jgi:hypothetical protein